MHFTPHPYQSRAIDFVLRTPNCMLFLDMGLGKSVITLTAIARLVDGMELRRVLIVAPKSVAEATWSAEVAKWDHLTHLHVSQVMGNAEQRLRALNADADIYVLSRDNLVWFVKDCRRDIKRFDALVLDELTTFKNPQAKRFKAVRAIRAQFRRIIGLTGTPAPNGYLDLWAQVFCIDGGQRLGITITRFRDRYFVIDNPYVTWPSYKLAPGAQATIEDKIADISLAMRAEDYLTLPDSISILLPVTLPPSLLKKYQSFEKEQILQLVSASTATSAPASAPAVTVHRGSAAGSPSSTAILASNAAALSNKLLQFANGAIYDDSHCVHHVHDEKISALREIVEAAGSPVLVFYAFQHDETRIIQALANDYRVRTYEGPEDLTAWNSHQIDVLLAHPASTAYGLNMQQGGHTIVWFSMTWNLEHYQQANARLHRQGQQQPVRIYHLVAKGTIDERAYDALSDKATTQNHLLTAIQQLIKKYNP